MSEEALLQKYRVVADDVIGQFRRHPKVIGVAVCGSLVSGRVWEGSDLDVLVVMRDPSADWQAMTLYHGDVPVHLQVLSERFLTERSEGFRGGLLSQVFSHAEIRYDPEGGLARVRGELTRYPPHVQVHHAVRHVTELLAHANLARKALRSECTGDAFLQVALGFRALARVEYARRGRYAERMLMEDLIDVAPRAYKAYVWFVHGRKPVPERVRRSLAFFDGALDDIFSDVGPTLAAAVRSCGRPLTEEGLAELPAIDDHSPDLTALVQQMVDRHIVREDHRAVQLEGVTLEDLSEQLFDLF